MPYPTRSLELLLLLAGVFPSGLSYSLSYAFGSDPGTENRPKFLLILSLPFVALLSITGLFHAEWLQIHGPSLPWLSGGVLAIAVVFLVEYLTALLWVIARTRRLPKGLALQQYWAGKMTWGQHALLVVIAVGEELVFRGLGYAILGGSMGLPTWLVVGITSVLYAFNHTFFGPVTATAKFASGVIYGLLYLASGSLLVPVIAHVGYNFALLSVSRIARRPREQPARA